MMRSFLCRLLHSGHIFNLDFINTPKFANEIKSNSLHALFHTFRQPIEQLSQARLLSALSTAWRVLKSTLGWDNCAMSFS
ncbi:hypothetical protein BDV12DRAFT_166464 [Aspergillus spectabilis]